MKRRFFAIFFVCFLLITFFIRSWQLGTNPAGFFCDEASAGYDAYLLLQTGRDRHGELLPLFFKGFNFDNLSPYHVYLNVLPIAVFGMSEATIRLTPLIGSIFELVFFYFLLKEFIPKRFAFLGMVLLSISPWHFHIGRIHMADYYMWSLSTTIACLFFVRAYKRNQLVQYAIAGMFLALSSYGYVPSRMFNPIFSGFLIVFLLVQKKLRAVVVMALVFFLFLFPHIHFHLTDPNSLQRIKDTVSVDIKKQQQLEAFPWGHVLVKYLQHYSDLFLYQKGDADFPGKFIRRHSITGMGLMYPYQKGFVILGMIWLIYEMVKKKRYEGSFIFFLLLFFPLPDSLTIDGTPSATRSYIGVIPFQLLTAFGWYALFVFTRQLFPRWKQTVNLIFISLATFLVISSLAVLLVRANDNPQTTSDYWGWQFGPRDVMKYFLANQANYDEFYLQGEFNAPHIFLYFYDPLQQCATCNIGTPLELFNPNRRQLFAVTPVYLSQSTLPLRIVDKVDYPNGSVAFYLVTKE